MKFEETGLSEPLLKALREIEFTIPTPIQEQTIPLLLQGEDLVGQAQTGTGKTAAYGLPALEYCMHSEKEGREEKAKVGVAMPLVLVLSPTRELAVQITGELERLGKYAQTGIVCVYGGQEIERQLKAFYKRIDIVVGTPGRIKDHLTRGSLRLDGVKFVVIDEADRMLDMGFIYDVGEILDRTGRERQCALFSATIPREVLKIATDYMRSPQMVKVSEDKITVDEIKQKYVLVDARNRLGCLISVLRQEKPALALVFVRTKMSADRLGGILKHSGFEAETLHGDMRQGARDRAMRKFRDGRVHVLVATDLASRGLDVLEVSHVINYDMPEEPNTYIHRIGRTGRIGQEGVAVSLVFEDQLPMIEALAQITKMPIERIEVAPCEFRQWGTRGEEGGFAGRGSMRGGREGEYRRERFSHGRDAGFSRGRSGSGRLPRGREGGYGRSGGSAREGRKDGFHGSVQRGEFPRGRGAGGHSAGFGGRRKEEYGRGGAGGFSHRREGSWGRSGGFGGGRSYGRSGGDSGRVVKTHDGIEYYEGRKSYGRRRSFGRERGFRRR